MSHHLPHLSWELRDRVAVLQLDRAAKRNAINDELINSLASFFQAPPENAKVVVLHGAGNNFCAGPDLLEFKEKRPFEAMLHSQSWHRCFEPVDHPAREQESSGLDGHRSQDECRSAELDQHVINPRSTRHQGDECEPLP